MQGSFAKNFVNPTKIEMLYFCFYMYAEEKFKSYFGLKIAPLGKFCF